MAEETPTRPAGAETCDAAASPLLSIPIETKAHRLPPSPYQQLRHARHFRERKLVGEALTTLGRSEKVLERFFACGAGAWIMVHVDHPNILRINSSKCRNRFCATCQRERGWIIEQNLTHLAKKAGRNLSLITLTLAHHKTNGLRKQVDRLTEHFRELRRLKFWKDAVKAAAWVLEVKRGQDGKWHPHIHILAHADYMEQGRITSAWHSVTGDSHIVDIRRISANAGAGYISKYVSKPVDESVLNSKSDLQEFMLAMRGKRACATLGGWRSCPLAEFPEDEINLNDEIDMSPKKFRMLRQMDECIKAHWSGDKEASATLVLLGYEKLSYTDCPDSG